MTNVTKTMIYVVVFFTLLITGPSISQGAETQCSDLHIEYYIDGQRFIPPNNCIIPRVGDLVKISDPQPPAYVESVVWHLFSHMVEIYAVTP